MNFPMNPRLEMSSSTLHASPSYPPFPSPRLLPSSSPSPLLWPPFIQLHSCTAPWHAQLPSPHARSVSALPSRGGSADGSGDASGPGRRGGRGIVAIIIIQMRTAKLEPCPSPSGWLTVTNSSLIHPQSSIIHRPKEA